MVAISRIDLSVVLARWRTRVPHLIHSFYSFKRVCPETVFLLYQPLLQAHERDRHARHRIVTLIFL